VLSKHRRRLCWMSFALVAPVSGRGVVSLPSASVPVFDSNRLWYVCVDDDDEEPPEQGVKPMGGILWHFRVQASSSEGVSLDWISSGACCILVQWTARHKLPALLHYHCLALPALFVSIAADVALFHDASFTIWSCKPARRPCGKQCLLHGTLLGVALPFTACSVLTGLLGSPAVCALQVPQGSRPQLQYSLNLRSGCLQKAASCCVLVRICQF
jgi:hypothetical protein